MGERDLDLQKREECGAEPMQVDTFGGRLHVEWDTDSSATPIGELAFFAEFLKDAGVFDDWVDACQGWEAVEDEIKLAGREMVRRIVILRRPVKEELALARQKGKQVEMLFPDDAGTVCYEYAVLVAGCPVDTASIAQLYRDRADSENGFDERKNQWGWGGYTTRDIARWRLTARMVALDYNWWSWYHRMPRPGARPKAVTSRPLLLAAIGRAVRHGGQNHLYLTSMHAAGRVIAAMISTIRAGLRHVKHIAEQLPSRDQWELSESSTCWLVRYIVDRILASAQAVRRNQQALLAPAAGQMPFLGLNEKCFQMGQRNDRRQSRRKPIETSGKIAHVRGMVCAGIPHLAVPLNCGCGMGDTYRDTSRGRHALPRRHSGRFILGVPVRGAGNGLLPCFSEGGEI